VLSDGKSQFINLTDNKALARPWCNETSISYMRNSNNLGQAQGGVGVCLADQSIQGIVPGFPNFRELKTWSSTVSRWEPRRLRFCNPKVHFLGIRYDLDHDFDTTFD
jgi:hypothetical protein